MSRRRRARRRSTTEWAVRALLAGAAAGIGWISAVHSSGYALRTADPARAHALAPTDGRVTAQLAQRLSGAEASPADRARADRLARRALRQDATAVAAVSTLGINAQIRGDTAGARRLFGYAGHLSRRDLQSQLWAVEDAVARGDVPGALRHYDLALRTSRRAADLLFPILASALAEPSVRRALVGALAAEPPWAASFVTYAAGNGPDPRATASLLLALRRAGVPVPEEAGAALIGTLTAGKFYEQAWAYYALTRSGVDRRRSRDPRFTADPAFPSPFDWTPIDEGGVSVTIQTGDRGGLVDFSAPASVGGTLLRQLQLLPPGDYRLAGRSVGVTEPAETSPFWALTCADGRELGRIAVPNSTRANGVFAGRFTVPTGCPVQTLALVARPSDAVGGLSGRIDRAYLVPVR